MSTIIGGVFGLELDLDIEDEPRFLGSDHVFVANGRSALFLLASRLGPPRIWVPSYLCASILDAFSGLGCEVCFYTTDGDLKIPSVGWVTEVQSTDLVIVIDYFGFPSDRSLLGKLRERGAWIVQDACQALLSEGVGREADFVVFSPRKFLGVPDGGVLVKCSARARDAELVESELSPAPTDWWLTAFASVLSRRDFDLAGAGRDWFRLFQRSEAEAPVGAYAMSELSRRILTRGIGYRRIALARRANYETLLESLAGLALFPDLPSGVVPVGFPMRQPPPRRSSTGVV